MIQNRLKALPGYSLYQRVADKARNASVSSLTEPKILFLPEIHYVSFPETLMSARLLPAPEIMRISIFSAVG